MEEGPAAPARSMWVSTLESAVSLQWAGQGGEPGAPQNREKYPGHGPPLPPPHSSPRRPCVHQRPLLDACLVPDSH